MKRILIIDGNAEDESKVRESVKGDYDISSVSYFDINNIALSTVISVANTIDALDEYSSGHALRVAVCARDIAGNLGWDEKDCQNAYFVSLLHDIGMISVPDSILRKPGRLDIDEYEIVKRHTVKGAEIVRDINILDNLSDGVKYHHERWDGSGYPEALSQDSIPAIARLIAIADAYDAMSSDRVYRPRLTPEKIISEFLRCRGSQFDPDMTDVFIFMLKDGYSVDPDIEQTEQARERIAKDTISQGYFARSVMQQDERGEQDALTGLFTRSYLNTTVGNKIAKEGSGAFVMLKLNGIDKIADDHGAKEADKVIVFFSESLKSLFREADVVCRISYEVFAVFVSGESGKSVIEKKAGMIADMIKDDSLKKYDGILNIEMGISMCQEDGITFEELYGAALGNMQKGEQI